MNGVAQGRISLGLLGEKLGHSLSPKIHRFLFERLGLAGSYELVEVPRTELKEKVSQLRSGKWLGLNVTVPYKVDVIPLMDELSPEARSIGAVNTIHFTEDGAKGYNTDYFGFGKLLDEHAVAVEGRSVAVLGSGGASRAVVQYLLDHRCASLKLISRNPKNVPEVFHRDSRVTVASADGLDDGGDLIVNATPVGMFPHCDCSPVSTAVLKGFSAAVDLIYNPLETKFLQDARQMGLATANGLVMLAAQAVASEEIWLGRAISGEILRALIEELAQ